MTGCGDLAAQPDLKTWPSLLDTLPASIQAAVRAGRYAGDLSAALRDAIETGRNFIVPPGVFPFIGDMLEIRTPGQRILGTGGVLRRLPKRDGIGLLVSAERVTIDALHLDGSAPATLPSHHSDMVKITGHGFNGTRLRIIGSQGSNLRVDRAKDCRISAPVLTNAFQNNIIVCNDGTERVTIDKAHCDGTKTQNNIYVTADESGGDGGGTISRVVITDATCLNSADSGIELGYHSQDCRVIGGRVANSHNPALLQRDGRRNLWRSVFVETQRLDAQHPAYDGVAVVPLWEGERWDNASRFEAVSVHGPVRRGAFYWGQSGIERIDCNAEAFTQGDLPSDQPRIGSGDLKAGDVANIVVQGGRIDGFDVGDNWNFDGRTRQRVGCITRGVEFARCTRVFSCYNVVPVNSAIIDNKGSGTFGEEILLQGAQLEPSAAQPNAGLIYDGNHFPGAPHAPRPAGLRARPPGF